MACVHSSHFTFVSTLDIVPSKISRFLFTYAVNFVKAFTSLALNVSNSSCKLSICLDNLCVEIAEKSIPRPSPVPAPRILDNIPLLVIPLFENDISSFTLVTLRCVFSNAYFRQNIYLKYDEIYLSY